MKRERIKKPAIDIKRVCSELIAESIKLNIARTQLRIVVADVMGVNVKELSEWSIEELCQYVDLGVEFAKQRVQLTCQ